MLIFKSYEISITISTIGILKKSTEQKKSTNAQSIFNIYTHSVRNAMLLFWERAPVPCVILEIKCAPIASVIQFARAQKDFTTTTSWSYNLYCRVY